MRLAEVRSRLTHTSREGACYSGPFVAIKQDTPFQGYFIPGQILVFLLLAPRVKCAAARFLRYGESQALASEGMCVPLSGGLREFLRVEAPPALIRETVEIRGRLVVVHIRPSATTRVPNLGGLQIRPHEAEPC